MLSWYIFIPAYFFLAAVYLLFGVHNRRFIKCCLKCLPITLLLLQMLAVLVQHTTLTGTPVDKLLNTRQFIWAITFSAIGDGCLVFQKVFVVGIISFAVSLGLYITMLGLMESLASVTAGGLACGLCVLLLSLAIAMLFRKQTARMSRQLPHRPFLNVLILLYFSILSLLLWSAALLLLRRKDVAGISSFLGAAMFYTSDLLIVAGAIWDARVLQGRTLVMMTYYSAQLLLGFSVYLSLP